MSETKQIAEAVVTGHNTTIAKKDTAGWVSSLVCRLSDRSTPGEFKVRYQGVGAPAVGSALLLSFDAKSKAGLPLNAKFRILDTPSDEVESLVQLADKCKGVLHQKVRTPSEQAVLDSLVDSLADELALKAVLQEPVISIESLKVSGGQHLKPGEQVKIRGSGGAVHTVTMSEKGNLYCSCPAWKFQEKPSESRTCKHCDAVATCK